MNPYSALAGCAPSDLSAGVAALAISRVIFHQHVERTPDEVVLGHFGVELAAQLELEILQRL